MIDCKYFRVCGAPMCPMDEKLQNRVWYPSEEICRNREYLNLQLIKTQKKIAKKTRNKDGYYTFEMLNRNIRVTAAIKGLDPNKEDEVEKKRWFKIHPPIKKLSAEKKRVLSERAKKYLINGSK